MAKKIKIGKNFVALIIAVLVFAIITGMHLLGVFQFLENKSYDLRVRSCAESPRNQFSYDIILVIVDQDSIDWAQKERGWSWPWPRQAYARIVNFMNSAGAKSVAFDMIYSEPSVHRNENQDEIVNDAVKYLDDDYIGQASSQGNRDIREALLTLSISEDDASFIKASQNYGYVVQVVNFSNETGNFQVWPSGTEKPLLQPENFGSMLERFSVGSNEKGLFPIQGLRESAGALGSATGNADIIDGVYRRLKPFTLFDGRAVPGLSTASLLVSGKSPQIVYNEKSKTIEWEDISIPVDKDGYALLHFRKGLETYAHYKARDIILTSESFEKGEELQFATQKTEMGTDWVMYTSSNFKDSYVFFGVNAQGLFDIFPTPIDSTYPGVGGHATMLDNMIMGDFIRESELWIDLLILLAVVAVVVFLTISSRHIPLSAGGTLIIIAGIVFGSFMAYDFGCLWIPMVTFLAGAVAAYITVTLYNYATEGSQKRFIKSAFSQYLSPKVIEQIIQDPSQLKLGGEKREMTAIFTDVRSFSTISEALGDPTKLVELLNFYLTKMSNIVLDNQGTIDKYEGDAIIAFFGAPIHMDNHASLACRAAVKMKKAEVEINREALESGLVTRTVVEALAAKKIIESANDPNPIFTRLGINTGDMVVGNMGTPDKMDYTIMGNEVNLAARLEGVNKQYDTGGILISEYTRKHIGDEFVLRPLSRVRVVGINTPLRIYELLDISGEAPPELFKMAETWEQAFCLYEKKDFLAAKNIFETIYLKNKGDLAAKKYFNRCKKYSVSAPDEKSWDDGVDNLTEK